MTDVNIQDSTGKRITSSNPLNVTMEGAAITVEVAGLKGSTDYGTTSTGATAGQFTLTDAAKAWAVNIWSNYLIRITAGTGIGQVRTITSNTATVITVLTAWGATINNTSKYEIFEANTSPITNTWAQLTAAGSSAALATPALTRHSIWCTVASINTSVTIRIEGSIDNTNWANLDSSNADTTITANGTYGFTFTGLLNYIRVTFVSEVGGTAVTIDAKYLGM